MPFTTSCPGALAAGTITPPGHMQKLYTPRPSACSTKLYSVTSNTKVVVNALDQDVTIYWIVQSDKEDDVTENLLGK